MHITHITGAEISGGNGAGNGTGKGNGISFELEQTKDAAQGGVGPGHSTTEGTETTEKRNTEKISNRKGIHLTGDLESPRKTLLPEEVRANLERLKSARNKSRGNTVL